MKKIILLAAFLAMVGSPVLAQGANCAPRDRVVDSLQSKYSETVHARGLAANGTVVEVWGAAETGSWTITVTSPQGLTCLVASGQAFETVEQTEVEEGDPV